MRFEECRFAFLVDLCDLQANRNLVVDALVARIYVDDVATGSENVRTAKVYLETGLNLNAAARALSVHRNTVAYLLKHLADRYGLDLSSPVDEPELVFQALLSSKLLFEDS